MGKLMPQSEGFCHRGGVRKFMYSVYGCTENHMFDYRRVRETGVPRRCCGTCLFWTHISKLRRHPSSTTPPYVFVGFYESMVEIIEEERSL